MGSIEREFASIWQGVLGVTELSPGDHFFGRGGTSLDAVRLQLQVRRRIGVDLPMHRIIESPTFEQLFKLVRTRSAEDHAPRPGTTLVAPVGPDTAHTNGHHKATQGVRNDLRGSVAAAAQLGVLGPQSGPQRCQYILHRIDPNSTAYIESFAFDLRGALDAARLKECVELLVRRHEILRTTYAQTASGEPVQQIHDFLAPEWVEVDLRMVADQEERSTEADRVLEQLAKRPMDLRHGPILRALLVRLDGDSFRLLLLIHHIAIDEWSVRTLWDEFGLLYRGNRDGSAAPQLPPPESRYLDWCARRHQGDPDAHPDIAWWLEHLRGAPDHLEIPLERPARAPSNTPAGRHRFILDPDIVAGLRRITTTGGTSFFCGVFAAYAAFLARLTGQECLLVGTPVTLRDDPAVQDVVGFFVNMLPVRMNAAGDPSFTDFLQRVRQELLQAFAHRDAPLERIVEQLKLPRRNDRSPLIQSVMVSLDRSLATPDLGEVEVKRRPLKTSAAKWPILLSLEPQDVGSGLAAELEYDTGLYTQNGIERIAERLGTFLATIAAAPDRHLSEFPVVGARELDELVSFERGGPTPIGEASIVSVFVEVARHNGSRIAVSCAAESVTYHELDRWSNGVASRLSERGVKYRDIVAIELPRSIAAIAATLGVLKAGAAYLPLDAADPPARRAHLLELARSVVTITTAEAVATGTAARDALAIERDWLSSGQAFAPDGAIGRDAPAYVMFTSGSTGTPKPVVVPHRGVLRLVRSPDFAQLDPTVVFLHHSPCGFDASTLEIWAPLLNGARLSILPAGPIDLWAMESYVRSQGCNAIWLTAALFRLAVDELPSLFDSMRQVFTGGDVVSPDHVRRLLHHNPSLTVTNGYGPTENTTFTTCLAMTRSDLETGLFDQPLPIGHPINGTFVRVIDCRRNRAPIGVAGELYAGGEGVALGYLAEPGAMAERFVTDPCDQANRRFYRTGDLARWRPDGSLDFLGRADRQIKIRGFRIEPGEVEVALRGAPGVRDACVAPWVPPGRETQLAAWVVLENSKGPDTGFVTDHLVEKLPGPFIPSRIVAVDRIPITDNGKVDYASLPSPLVAARVVSTASPEEWSPTERQVGSLWRSVLDVAEVALDDDFFQLGGGSLDALELVSELEKAFHRRIPVSDLIAIPTVRGLSRRLAAQAVERPRNDQPVVIQAGSSGPPVFLIPGNGGEILMFQRLRGRLPRGRPLFGLPYSLVSRPASGELTIQGIAAAMIRALDRAPASGSPWLVGYSLGGQIAFEMALQLQEQGRRLGGLIVIDAVPRSRLPVCRMLARAAGDELRWRIWKDSQARDLARAAFRKVVDQYGLRLPRRARRDGTRDNTVPFATGEPGQLQRADYLRAFRRYRPGYYDGKLVLIRCQDDLDSAGAPEHLGWPRYVASLDFHTIPGSHLQVLSDVNTDEVVSILASYLGGPASQVD
jgi:amino acid adenylation domain-containing protein